jgi:hypothetical protein
VEKWECLPLWEENSIKTEIARNPKYSTSPRYGVFISDEIAKYQSLIFIRHFKLKSQELFVKRMSSISKITFIKITRMEDILKLKIFKLLNHKLSIEDFESWIYIKENELEVNLEEELYFDLISFNYKSKHAKQDFFKAFDRIINKHEFEIWKINDILESIINNDEYFGDSLMRALKLRDEGYWFLDGFEAFSDIGLIAEKGFYMIEEWSELSGKMKLFWSQQPHKAAKLKALKVQNWLKEQKIVITEVKEEYYDTFIWEDYREKEELTEVEREILSYDELEAKIKVNEKNENKRSTKRRWWKFW